LKNKIVRVKDRPWVSKMAKEYRDHKQALKELNVLNNKEQKILKKNMTKKLKKYE